MYVDIWVNNQVLENPTWRTGAILNLKKIVYESGIEIHEIMYVGCVH